MLLPGLLLGLALALLALYLYRLAYERPHNFPPGPPRLPIWGSYWLLLWENYRFLHLALRTVAQRYRTGLLGLHLGPFPAVVASSYQAVREVFTRTEFAGRPFTVLVASRSFGKPYGIFFNDGQPWAEQRRFMLRNMRDYGFGRRYRSMEQTLAEQTEELLALLRGDWADPAVAKDGCVLMPDVFFPAFLNLLWTMMAGECFPREQHGELRRQADAAKQFAQSVDPLGGAVSITPWLLHVAPEATRLPAVVRGSAVLAAAIEESLRRHQETYSEDHMRDFIDRYIREMRRQGARKELSFHEEQLQIVGADLLLASAATTTGTLTFLFNAAVRQPEVQRRVQAELDRVVGRGRLPSLDDRPNLPYTEAALRESMRRNTMLPLALPHLARQDTQLQGYHIPKNTLLFSNTWAVHMDPELWGDPENFRPERFLDERGRLVKDTTMPFGAGKRLCPGETYSRQTMFVLFAALLQSFSFEPAVPGQLPSLDDMKPGLAVTPADLRLRAVPRG